MLVESEGERRGEESPLGRCCNAEGGPGVASHRELPPFSSDTRHARHHDDTCKRLDHARCPQFVLAIDRHTQDNNNNSNNNKTRSLSCSLTRSAFVFLLFFVLFYFFNTKLHPDSRKTFTSRSRPRVTSRPFLLASSVLLSLFLFLSHRHKVFTIQFFLSPSFARHLIIIVPIICSLFFF